MKRRTYNWFEYQLSGSPYHGDYPDMGLDIGRIRADLTKLRRAGLRTIIAFRDDVGPDCSYLQETAAATQDLVDCVMGIYESNGVFDWDYPTVESVLRQQKQLWPKAINAFHSTSQDNGGRGFGEMDFWQRMEGIVDVYFIQQSAWNHSFSDTLDRLRDFTDRLMGGKSGWPTLPHGVVLFEETTTVTYHEGASEQYAIGMTNSLMDAPARDGYSRRPTGYMDGGTVAV